MATATKRHDNLTRDTIKDALGLVDMNVSRSKWARIGMALKAELGDGGFPLFDEWSRKGDTYNESDCISTWKSLNAGGGVNIGTLIYEAQLSGFELNGDRQTLSAEQIAERKRKREEEEKQRAAEKKRLQGEAAKLSNLLWNAAEPAIDDHPYLEGKGVSAHGLAMGEWPLINDKGEVFRRLPGALLIPIMDAKNGKVMSLQGILLNPDGGIDKRYLKNGRKQGGFHMVGSPPCPGEPLVFCEGYATGATIHELTGWCVIVTFDAPNLPVVAKIMRDQFAGAPFIICADNDAWTKLGDIENPGVHYANEAAQATRALVISPKFADVTTRPTDFNDLAKLEGPAVAREQLFDNPMKRSKVVPIAPTALPAPGNDNVDYATPLPRVGARAKPRSMIQNLEEIVRRLGVDIRYNVISKGQEILIPGASYLVDNCDNDSLTWLKSECAMFDMPTESLSDFVTHIAGQNPFNPVDRWINSKPWDGVPRLQKLYDTVTPVEDKRLLDGRSLKEVLIWRWLMSALAGAFCPEGVSAHGILVFQGPQYLGKTMWFKQLVPEHLELLQDGMMLNPSDRDSVKQVVSFWLVELGELDATFRKADLAALKSFVTRKQDILRLPYARKESKLTRRTVFFGSVNPREFLHDPTGNRRYWTIECAGLDLEAQRQLDMQQVWAEAYTLYQAGEQHFLTPEEMDALNDHNQTFQAIDTVEERLQTGLDWGAPGGMWNWKTSTDILLSVGIDRPTNSDATKAALAIRKMNGGQGKRSNGKNVLWCPPAKRSGLLDDRPF